MELVKIHIKFKAIRIPFNHTSIHFIASLWNLYNRKNKVGLLTFTKLFVCEWWVSHLLNICENVAYSYSSNYGMGYGWVTTLHIGNACDAHACLETEIKKHVFHFFHNFSTICRRVNQKHTNLWCNLQLSKSLKGIQIMRHVKFRLATENKNTLDDGVLLGSLQLLQA